MTWNQDTVNALQRLAATSCQIREVGATMRRQVIEARGAGASWEAIGQMVGCTGEAARVKYGPKMPKRREPVLF